MRKVRDEWTVMLNPDIVPRVRLNRMYADLFRSHRDSSHADLAAQLQEARWTVRNVEQRFSTILRVGQAIAKRQRAFLDYGELAMKPLGLREIAEELGLHESTVSRVTNNKYMATPLGVFELKFFFSRALATSNGGHLLDNGDPRCDQGNDRGRGREQSAVRRAHRASAVAPRPAGRAPHRHQVPSDDESSALRGAPAGSQKRSGPVGTGPTFTAGPRPGWSTGLHC